MTILINKIKKKIETDFELGGYKVKDTHFENGRNLHSGQYYFAKKYFQNTENCDEIAQLLIEKLRELNLKDSTTLIGFRNYTGLLLNKTIELIGKYNYAIIEQDNDEFVWHHLPFLRENLVIILPVTCTCSTYIKLRKFINDYVKNHIKDLQVEVNNNFINIFLILEQSLSANESETIEIKKLKDSSKEHEKKIFDIYSGVNWTEITPTRILFNNKTATTYAANPLVRLYSELYPPETCPLCFPDGITYLKEKPLFPTHDNYETPNLIFGFPNFNATVNHEDFFDIFAANEKVWNTHLYGHVTVNSSSYLNYIRGNTFYEKNKSKILFFFNAELTKYLKVEDKDILFITAETKHNSSFLEDISTSGSLKGRSVTILRFEPSNEFVDNFISLHSKSITDKYTKVIYFEDVISAAKTFKLISNYIKHTKKDAPKKVGRHGFDLVLTLVDRTPLFTKDEILKKIFSDKNCDEIESKFISFYKLNVPIIAASHLGNPLRKRMRDLEKMILQCHLDALKATIGRELVGQQPRKLPELDLLDTENDVVFYFPFSNIEESWDENILKVYEPYLYKERQDLLKLYLSHEINCELAKEKYNRTDFFNVYKFEPHRFITELIETINDNIKASVFNFFVLPKDKESSIRQQDVEQKIIHDTIIKILSRHPFSYYKNIYEAVFSYCYIQLDNLHKKIERSGIKSFLEFWQLRFYIKRSIELNSNFIISERFLYCIKKQYNHRSIAKIKAHYDTVYLKLLNAHQEGKISPSLFKTAKNNIVYKQSQAESYFTYLLFCYKELVFKNPFRSIVLENLINSPALLPKEINEPHKYTSKAKDLLSNPYFQFSGMVKAENLYLLHDLKELHKANIIKQLKGGLNVGQTDFSSRLSILNYYIKKKKNDPIILNALKLIRHSRYLKTKDLELYRDLQLAISNMLYTVSLLEIKKRRKETSNQPKFNLDIELREILDSVIKIIQPNDDGNKIEYAFFVEYRRRNKNALNSENIYSMISDDDSNNASIVLNTNGLIYKMLYGLYDGSDMKNEQTLISVGRSDNNTFFSFKTEYFYKQNESVKAINFTDLFQGDIYNETTGEGIKLLTDANICLALRLSNFLPSDIHHGHFEVDGQAVLLITTSAPSNTENFLRFMSNEKVRLLLLIKEELLEYLQKQFNNDAFIEILQRQNSISYQGSLRHGLTQYTDSLEYLMVDLKSEIATSEDKAELFSLIIKAMKGQLQEIENLNESARSITCSKDELLRTIKLIFESTRLGSYLIDFSQVDITSLEFTSVELNRLIKDVIIPEIIINMKKYCPRYGERGLSISYSVAEQAFYFKNKKAKIIFHPKNKNNSGGLAMAKNILLKSEIGEIDVVQDDAFFTLRLKLNRK